MKTSIILLLTLLAVTACAPQPAVAPVPTLVPVTGGTPVATGIPVATSAPCTCPSSVVTPGQPAAGSVSPDHVICNCPIMLVTPPAPGGGGSSPQAIPSGGITLPDDGKTFIVPLGNGFLLNLGTDTFDWTVSIDNQNVISREKNVMPIRGAQGVYQALAPGQAVLSAVGVPICQSSIGPCMTLEIYFKVTIIVQ
jgi:hypothetical protein